MRDHSPSWTALRVAALRALHQTEEVPPIFVDPLAARILGKAGVELLDEHRGSAMATVRLRATLAVRACVAEEQVAAAVARGTEQCVILGAGLDTFAYRHDHADLRVFEVDHPATQGWKRDCLRAGGIAVPASVRYVAADFLRDDLLAALGTCGFDQERPSIFVMLGVVVYLDWVVTTRLLGTVAAAARGTEIVFDYTAPFDEAPPHVQRAYKAAAARVAAMGEPWRTFRTPAVIGEALREAGLTEIRDLDAAALDARYCTGRTDGLAVTPLLHLASARL